MKRCRALKVLHVCVDATMDFRGAYHNGKRRLPQHLSQKFKHFKEEVTRLIDLKEPTQEGATDAETEHDADTNLPLVEATFLISFERLRNAVEEEIKACKNVKVAVSDEKKRKRTAKNTDGHVARCKKKA